MKLLIVLQNAYGVEDGFIPSYERHEFINSHTGKRLKEVLTTDMDYDIINANPKIGDTPDSCFLPDYGHLREVVNDLQPDVILACGKVAEKAVKKLHARAKVYMPHPAYRALSKKTTGTIKDILITLLDL